MVHRKKIMATLLRFVCENSESCQISRLLENFVDSHESSADSGVLESLKFALLTITDASNLSEEFVRKTLFKICWPIVFNNSSPDKESVAQSGKIRERHHLCCDLITLCCKLYPSLLTEVCEKCILNLQCCAQEKDMWEENICDVSVTIDVIGYFKKSGILVSDGELEDRLFQVLLHILPRLNDRLCSKLTGFALPYFLDVRQKERSQAVWNVIKQVFQLEATNSNDQNFHQSYTILCGLADFFLGQVSNSERCHIHSTFEFWEIIQHGLVLTEPLSWKRAVYLLKRALDLLGKQPQDLLIQQEKRSPIFYWNCDKKDSLMALWQDYILLMETLDEKQAHIIKPVLPRMASIVTATKRDPTGSAMLDITWLLTLYQRAAKHDNKYICRWAIMGLLSLDVTDSPLQNACYWWFLQGPLLGMLSDSAIYAKTDGEVRGDEPAVGVATVRFFTEFVTHLPVADRKEFSADLLVALVDREFTQVPLLFMFEMFANLPPFSCWDASALTNIRTLFPKMKAFNIDICRAIQSFILKAVINLTDPAHVGWNDIADLLSLLASEDCFCRGGILWEATIDWVWQMSGKVGQQLFVKTSLESAHLVLRDLFGYLEMRLEGFLSDNILDLSSSDPEVQSIVRMVLIVCDACVKFTADSESRRQLEKILRDILGVVQHASTHVYASGDRAQKAALLFLGILEHVNATKSHLDKESEALYPASQHLDECLEVIKSLVASSSPEVLELITRKLTMPPSNYLESDKNCTFLDLARELYAFVVHNTQSFEGVSVYIRFVENLIAKSRNLILERQAVRHQLVLSEWFSFVLSMKCLAWCCFAVRTKPGLFPTHVVHDLLQTVAKLDLCSEFSKPQLIYPMDSEFSANASTKGTKGWGIVVSDFLEAQWLCIEFLLEESQGNQDRHMKVLWDELKPFLESLPDASLEVLSLGSRQAVLPIIRCVRLLTPRMLLKDHTLCSQAMEAVWWTFQDRQKHDNFWFWGTLKEATRVLFNPCLLALPGNHPVTLTVLKFWGELLALGEDRPGVFNHVISPCCQFWSNCSSDANMAYSSLKIPDTVRKECLQLHVEFLTEACIFGPREKKTKRVTNYVVAYVRRLSEQGTICRLFVNELREDVLVRVNAINTLLSLNPRSEPEKRVLQNVLRALISKDNEFSGTKQRSAINSFTHLKRHRIWQAVLVILSRLNEFASEDNFAQEILEEIFSSILKVNETSVRQFLEWGMLITFHRHPNLIPLLLKQLKYDPDRRPNCVTSFLAVAALLGQYSFSGRESQAAYIRQALPAILPWGLTSHVMSQMYAQVAVQKLWLVCRRQNLQDVLSEHNVIKACVDFLATNNEGVRPKTRVLSDIFFFDVHPYRDFSIQTLYETLPRLTEVTDEEWISPKVFTRGLVGMRVWNSRASESWGLPLCNPSDTRLGQRSRAPYFNYEENMGLQITRRLEGEEHEPRNFETTRNEDGSRREGSLPQTGDVQKKIRPWKVLPPDDEMLLELRHQRMVNLQKDSSSGNLIVVASLIDKAPNLGGLCRTCEIFGVQSLVLSNTHVIEDVQFKSLSVSAAKWMNIQEVRLLELKDYLARMRHEGYSLIGVEQTANSETLTQFQFPQKSLMLLGNEREGIPVELIQMLDVCVEIPQVGVIRSLNVHVSGALLVWEYTRQRALERDPDECTATRTGINQAESL